MKVLVQRVREARVEVAGDTLGAIGQGLLLLVGIERDDQPAKVQRMAKRVTGYRLFSDAQGKMNLDVGDIGGAVLVVSQFTLAADTRQGRRPGFSAAADPNTGRRLFEMFVAALAGHGLPVATGRFGADMQVHLVNDGPVTFLLEL
jgi:D-tyrosyl-tRNA(Tyr) deacylase